MTCITGHITTVIAVADAIRPAISLLGLTGELEVRMDGSKSVSWIGQPSGADVIVTVIISAMAEGTEPLMVPDCNDPSGPLVAA